MTLDGFFKEVWDGIRVSDVIQILSVPVVLSLVFLLPESLQNGLVLEYENPTVFNLWSSAFVHEGFSHFTNNLGSYFVLIIPIYLLFILAEERKLFQYTFFSFLSVLPFVISLANLILFETGTGTGFSGIGSAFFGLLPISLFLFIHNRLSEEIYLSHTVVLFLVSAGVTALIYSGVLAATAIFLITILLSIYYGHHIGSDELRSVFADLRGSKGYFELVLFSSFLFLISPVMLFPQNIAQDGVLVNIFSHYLGLVLGFFLPYLYLMYRQQKKNEQNQFSSILSRS